MAIKVVAINHGHGYGQGYKQACGWAYAMDIHK